MRPENMSSESELESARKTAELFDAKGYYPKGNFNVFIRPEYKKVKYGITGEERDVFEIKKNVIDAITEITYLLIAQVVIDGETVEVPLIKRSRLQNIKRGTLTTDNWERDSTQVYSYKYTGRAIVGIDGHKVVILKKLVDDRFPLYEAKYFDVESGKEGGETHYALRLLRERSYIYMILPKKI